MKKKNKINDTELIYSRIKLYYSLRTDAELASFLGITASALSNSIVRNSLNWNNIITKCEDINLNWLYSGNDVNITNQNVHDFTHTHTEQAPQLPENQCKDTKKLIPLYGDVSSIGGYNGFSANMDGISKPSEWIDKGDWFVEATFAIRHYGDSMVEYPNGCILALKEITNIQSLIWGCDYVIETEENRVTKRVQKGNMPNSITAYSSNIETYPDGRLIHEPMDIPIESIRRIALVLGYVVKKCSSGMVYAVTKQ